MHILDRSWSSISFNLLNVFVTGGYADCVWLSLTLEYKYQTIGDS